jgi:hypothetical protein
VPPLTRRLCQEDYLAGGALLEWVIGER